MKEIFRDDQMPSGFDTTSDFFSFEQGKKLEFFLDRQNQKTSLKAFV